jgi:hypothetical protein
VFACFRWHWPSTINTQNIFFKFYYLTELLGFLIYPVFQYIMKQKQ